MIHEMLSKGYLMKIKKQVITALMIFFTTCALADDTHYLLRVANNTPVTGNVLNVLQKEGEWPITKDFRAEKFSQSGEIIRIMKMSEAGHALYITSISNQYSECTPENFKLPLEPTLVDVDKDPIPVVFEMNTVDGQPLACRVKRIS